MISAGGVQAPVGAVRSQCNAAGRAHYAAGYPPWGCALAMREGYLPAPPDIHTLILE